MPHRIEVPENPTTGYQWEIEFTDGLRLLRSEYHPQLPLEDETGDPLVGGGGTRVFVFEGRGSVTLVYRRPWDHSDVADKRTYSF